MKKIFTAMSFLLLVLLFNGCAKNPVTGKRDFMLMSESQEIAMGQQSDPDIVKFFGIYDDKKLQQFIDEKGQQMADVSHRKNLKYEFKIVDSPVVNAFAVPGGYVYFTRGIMAHFNNEAEFAGVLGHEIGHITARHSAKQYSNAMVAQIGLVAGMVLAPEFAQFADLAQNGIGLLFLKFGRDAESQSDKLGVEYSTKINYDAHEMAGFFKTLDRLQSQSGGEVPTFLSTHPDPADREVKVAKLADDWQRKTKSSSLKVNRESYLRMIDGIIYGEDPKQGFVENNIFYHPVLKFQFPVPTQWSFQNTPEQVQMASSDGKAMLLFTLAPGGSLESAAQSVLKNYQLTLVESKKHTVNGLPVIAMVADQAAQEQQQNLRTLIYVIEHGGNVYAMIGATQVTLFNNYAATFKNSMEKFDVLNDASKLNKKPERVRIKTVQQKSTLEEVLKAYNVDTKRMQENAILNGMQLTESIDKGSLIKVISQ